MKHVRVWLLGVAVLVLLLWPLSFAHCAVKGPTHSDQFGTLSYVRNPNVYLFASIVEARVDVKDHHRYATVVRFNPAHTFMLFSETIVFCGDETAKFTGATGPLVVTYERTAHYLFQGQPCHQLESVDRVQATEPLP